MIRILLLLLLLVSTSSISQSISEMQANRITSLLSEYASDETPGMAVGIVVDGNIVYEKYVGFANLEHKVKVDLHTRFNIASNAKQFTALGILKLIEEGKLNIEDDFRKYLPDIHPTIEHKISIGNLLNHTSGIRDVYDLWALKGQTWWKLFIDNDDALDLLENQRDLNFLPGTEFMYSNSNYILLAEIIKNVSGIPFAEYAQDLFTYMDLPCTSFLTNYMEVIPHKARPYGNWNGWKEYPAISEIHGDGALFTTLKDQLAWEIIIQNNNGNQFSQQLLVQSQSPLDDDPDMEYGYGLMFGTYKGHDYVYHDGNTGAYNATFLRFPNHKTGIVVMSNNGNVPTNYLAKQIADEILLVENIEKNYPSGPENIYYDISPSDIIGIYQSIDGDGTIINIVEKNDTVYREIYQREPVKLEKERGSLYAYTNNKNLKMAFEKQGAEVTGFTIYLSSQAPATYKKLKTVSLDAEYKASLNGTYFNEETQTTIIIEHRTGTEYALIKNGRERKAELLYKDLLRMNSYKIEVMIDEKGNNQGLKIRNGRIKNVQFDKK